MTTGYYDALGNRTSKRSAADIGAGTVNLAAIIAVPALALYFIFREKPAEAKPNAPAAPDPAMLEEIQSALSAVGLTADGTVVGPAGTSADVERLKALATKLRSQGLPTSADQLLLLADKARARQQSGSGTW